MLKYKNKKMVKGFFIVIYGINNIGKSTQSKILIEHLNKIGRKTKLLKYPVYNQKPAGPIINDYLRGKNKFDLSSRELQLFHYIDRLFYQPKLIFDLNQGIDVVAEDYFGTGMAWGMGSGVDPELLKELYKHLHKEDLAFLMDGKRFPDSIEKKHRHENDEKLIHKVRKTHLLLAKEFGWHIIAANRSKEEIADEIWQITRKKIKI